MKLFNFGELGNKLEEFFLIKADVEDQMLQSGELKEKMELQDFITFAVSNTIIYFSNNQTLPFSILKGKETNYVIYTALEKNELLLQELENKLEAIQCDANKLTKMDVKDTLDLDYTKEQFFIKDGYYHK